MGGSIEADSALGVGTTFRVRLPITEPAEATQGEGSVSAPTEPVTGETRTILYIEDNLANLQLVQGILAYRPSITLVSAMHGNLGLDLARRHQPDLILLDLHLPDISGEEVFKLLKEDPATSAIPVVIVSADASRETLKRLEGSGINHFLTKPVNVALFLDTIDAMLE
jgi:CheY-like chemotaxis protein